MPCSVAGERPHEIAICISPHVKRATGASEPGLPSRPAGQSGNYCAASFKIANMVASPISQRARVSALIFFMA